jgi:hypothetical protein
MLETGKRLGLLHGRRLRVRERPLSGRFRFRVPAGPFRGKITR